MSGAANIVSSSFTSYAQKDGRHTVVELHTDLVTLKHQLVYLAGAADNLNTNLATHANRVALDLDSAEVAANVALAGSLGSQAALTFVYSTAAESYLAIRNAYLVATGALAINYGDFLHTLTVLQIQTAFNFATAVLASNFISSTLAPQATTATTVRAAVGA